MVGFVRSFEFDLNDGISTLNIGHGIRVSLIKVKGSQVRIGVDAPRDVPVHREEIFHAIRHGLPLSEDKAKQQLLYPKAFACVCGGRASTKRSSLPGTKKRRSYWQTRCGVCSNAAPHARSFGLSILEWNLQPVSQTPLRLAFPGLEDRELSLSETKTLLLVGKRSSTKSRQIKIGLT